MGPRDKSEDDRVCGALLDLSHAPFCANSSMLSFT
jgi:hypothetical protein